MEYTGLALVVSALVFAVVALVLLARLFGTRGPECGQCGAALAREGAACTVCITESRPGPRRERPLTIEVETRKGEHHPSLGYLNPGIRPWMVKGALAAMAIGLSVRVVGMLDPVGLDLPVSDYALAVVTVVGGLVAFVGFIVLDVA